VTQLYRRGTKYLVVAGLPIAAFSALASDRFIPLLFGPDYLASVRAAQLLLPAAAFMFLSNFGETTLACINRWMTIVVVSTAALALNVGLNLMWIPRHGYLGAAWATLATEGAYFVMTAVALHRMGHRVGWPSILVRPLAATVVFASVLWIACPLGLVPSSVLASAAFVAATFLFGVWDEQERSLMRGALRGRPNVAGDV
jgi:O-antigen/teichoic acid export membrane protein